MSGSDFIHSSEKGKMTPNEGSRVDITGGGSPIIIDNVDEV